jgi:hypothetical protein
MIAIGMRSDWQVIVIGTRPDFLRDNHCRDQLVTLFNICFFYITLFYSYFDFTCNLSSCALHARQVFHSDSALESIARKGGGWLDWKVIVIGTRSGWKVITIGMRPDEVSLMKIHSRTIMQ